MTESPLRAAIVPVTRLQQNATLLWCTATMRGAIVDPGGDLPRLLAARDEHGVTVEKILLTHGHYDHCAEAAALAAQLDTPIEGPHEADRYWIARLEEDGRPVGLAGKPFEPDRWLDEGDTVTVGELSFTVHHTPGHTPGHIVFHHAGQKLVISGDVLFQGSVGRTDFPLSDPDALIDSIVTKLWPMGDDTVVLPGHGPMTNIAHERRTNPFVSDSALATKA